MHLIEFICRRLTQTSTEAEESSYRVLRVKGQKISYKI